MQMYNYINSEPGFYSVILHHVESGHLNSRGNRKVSWTLVLRASTQKWHIMHITSVYRLRANQVIGQG